MKVKEESEKVGLKLNIQKMKISASGPITSWKIDGETVETVTSLAPHERLPEILVVPREKTPKGAAARGKP